MSVLISSTRVVWNTLVAQVCLFLSILFVVWGLQRVYAWIDRTTFPEPVPVPADAAQLPENEKGKILLDAISNQMRRELDSTFGWTYNDILFNRVLLDNRAYRQYGVYHATKFLIDLYASQIAKLGASERESEFLYQARTNSFSLNPGLFWFPSAESAYGKGLGLLEKYKNGLDNGKEVYNCRTDDVYASFVLVTGENLLGYAIGLLEDAQHLPFYTLDNRIYEIQGIVLVVRDFINTLYALYPSVSAKNNTENMASAMDSLTRICTYDPLYITSTVNSGELILSYLLFAKSRLEDIRDSIRI